MKKTILVVAAVACIAILTASGGESKGTESVSATDVSAITDTPTKEEAMSTVEEEKSANDVYEFYKLTETSTVVPFTILEKAESFLKTHGDLFPANAEKFTDDKTLALVDFNLEAKHILKNESKYGDMLMSLPELGVAQVWEAEKGDSGYYTVINAVDSLAQQYFIIYNGELDIFENDEISCYGLPLAVSSFENTDGGTTLVIVLAGSVVEKITS